MQINFEIEPGKEGDILARFKFWDSSDTAQWFKDHGYTLYKRVKESAVLRPALPSESHCDDAEYPYGYFDSSKSRPSSDPLEVYERWGKVAYAQDSANRHVVIKIVPNGTEEYRVLEFLKSQTLEDLKENCVMPVLDLLPIEGYYFAIMPRWGYSIDVPYMQDIQEVIIMIHSLLKGLAYLHGHNIAHGVNISPSSCFLWNPLTLPS
uniref:Protein kinase domain-containing protein n=1 Tax=Psilocybe cubensis TaxID=181762 RepID=A0A8H8CDK7_PSICU